MADGLSQPPTSASGARRGGPPPLPRGAVDSQPSLLSPSAESAVDELLALLGWRARDAAQAAEVLAQAGDEGRVARRLALALAGSWAPLVKAVGAAETAEADLDALAEAAQTAQDRLGDGNAARAMLWRAFNQARGEGATGE